MMRANHQTPWHWVMYDWANSAFALSVMSAFFPAFFKQFWRVGVDQSVVTLQLGLGNTIAGLLIAILCPFLGAAIGVLGYKKKTFIAFVLVGVLATLSLFFYEKNMWLWAMGAFILGRLGFSVANFFYDSMLIDMVDEKDYDRVSATGYAFGYLGCAILFTLQLLLFVFADQLGITKAMATRVSFLSVALWWLVFSLPLFFKYKQVTKNKKISSTLMKESLSNLSQTASEIIKNKNILLFLIAFWFYNDGVHTFVLMAGNFASNIGIDDKGMLVSLLFVQIVAFPCALAFGKLAQWYGAKKMILVAIGIYLGLTLIAPMNISKVWHFFVAAGVIGMAQGGIQALSRSLFAKIIPSEKANEYFGFYNFMGKFSMVIGPAFMGFITWGVVQMGVSEDGAARWGATSLGLLFICGYWLLTKVDEKGSTT